MNEHIFSIVILVYMNNSQNRSTIDGRQVWQPWMFVLEWLTLRMKHAISNITFLTLRTMWSFTVWHKAL